MSSTWNIAHTFVVIREDAKTKDKFTYYLRSSCCANVRTGHKTVTEQSLHVFKELLEKSAFKKETPQGHVDVIGKMLEKMEGVIRKEIEFVHLRRLNQIAREVRCPDPQRQADEKTREALLREIFMQKLQKKFD